MLEVASLIHQAVKECNVNRTQLAELLGITKGRVTQCLGGERNLTLRTLADIFTALGKSLVLKIEDLDQSVSDWESSNHSMTLESVAGSLSAVGLEASIRGTEAASFVFVESQGRAAEISLSEGLWRCEFWEASEDENAAPVREELFTSDSQMFAEVKDWLKVMPRGPWKLFAEGVNELSDDFMADGRSQPSAQARKALE